MKIIENHFEGKNTYIIGKLIKNGCQTFTIDRLDDVCVEYNVGEYEKKEVEKLYYENGENENWEELVKHEDFLVRKLVATQGHCMYVLTMDIDYRVRYEVARQGYGLDILVNDEHYIVRAEAAGHRYGLDFW